MLSPKEDEKENKEEVDSNEKERGVARYT